MKIMIAVGQAMVREGTRCLLGDSYRDAEFDEASSFEELLQRCGSGRRYDAILLAAQLPGMFSYGSLDAIRLSQPDARLIVLSDGHPETAVSARAALEHGVHGYVPRTSGARVLVAALNLVLDGGVYIPPMLVERPAEVLPPTRRRVADCSPARPLTHRQHAILECLREGQSTGEMARKFGLPADRMKAELAKLYKRMGVKNRTQAAVSAPMWL